LDSLGQELELDSNRGTTADPVTYISSLRDERLPKGTRFAREPLDADTTTGPAFQAGPLLQLNLSS